MFKEYSYPFPEDWLEEIVKSIQQQKAQGLKPILSHPENSSNGFYHRNLYLSFGNLNLKVPRVRIENSFCPSILPPPWKRIDKDYEKLLIAMLANGYSKAQSECTLKKLGLPYSDESQLHFYRSQPLKPDWFAIFIDAFWTKIKDPETKSLRPISLFVAK